MSPWVRQGRAGWGGRLRSTMSFRAKRELLVQVAPRYGAARHGQRSAILDEFIAVTGYDRKYAIRVLLGPIQPPAPIRRPRRAYYGREVQEALASAWLAANGICAKRLVPFLVEMIPTLERHGHLSLTDEVREQVLALSSATADRLLRPLRHPHGLTTTKPGRLLKKQIPIRTFTEWNDVKPGFLEADLVAHCRRQRQHCSKYRISWRFHQRRCGVVT